ncbi:MAG: hypothetical protein AAB367_04130 [Patescibacteria group bacterium]
MLSTILLLVALAAPPTSSTPPPQASQSSSVPDCTGEKVKDFEPVLHEHDSTIQAVGLGRSLYENSGTGRKCLFYSSSKGGEVIWQTRRDDDGSFTAWVLQKDKSYRKYENAAIRYDNEIQQDEEGNETLVFLLEIVRPNNNMKDVVDTASFAFEIKRGRSA